MARSFGAESLGADGFAVRGAVSAAPAVGCALVELGSNQLGWTSAPVALNSDLSLKANRAGDTFTGDVIINRTWLGTPTEDKNVIKVGRYQSGSVATVNSPIAWYEHIADAPYPYCGFVLKHGLNPGIVDGRNPGGSYINMIGPEHSFAIQFDYLSSVGTPNYQGDAQYNLTGPQSKHIFRVNNGTEVGRIDANGLTASTGKLFLANSASNATWQARAEFGDLNIETLSGTTNSIYLRANSGKSIVQNIAGTNVATVNSTGLTVVGSVIATSGNIGGTTLRAVSGEPYIEAYGVPLRLVGYSSAQVKACSNSGFAVRNQADSADAGVQCSGLTTVGHLAFNSGGNISFPTGTLVLPATMNASNGWNNANLVCTSQNGAGGMRLDATFNNAGLTPTAFAVNVTDTASNAASLLMDLRVAGVSKFGVRKDGAVLVPSAGIGFGATGVIRYDGTSNSFESYGGVNIKLNASLGGGSVLIPSTIVQGTNDARWTIPGVGQRNSDVGNGSGTWQTGYREEYNAGGVRAGFFGATPVAQQSIAAAATDPATTQTLANSLRTAMLNLGLGV